MNDPSDSIVMNALSATVLGESDILADEETEDLVRRAFDVVDGTDRRRFEAELVEMANLSAGDSMEPSSTFEDVVRSTLSELDRMGVSARIDHRVDVEVSSREATLYSLFRNPNPNGTDLTFLSSSFRSGMRKPLRLLAESQYTTAAESLDSERVSTEDEEEELIRRVLRGWSYFWDGNDERASEIADRALHRCDNCWDAKLLWMASTHERSHDIRGGNLDLGVVLAWASEVPDGSTLDVFVDLGESDTPAEGRRLYDENECVLFERLGTTNRITFRLAGKLRTFPTLPSYHVSVATTEAWSGSVDEVERILKNGPVGDGGVETLRLYD